MKRVVENFRLPFFNYLHILHICAIKIKIMSFIRNIILSVFSLTLLSCNYLETEKFYIGVSQCSYDEWRDKMNSEMQTEAMLSHQITLEIRSADDDSRKQTEDIMYFIKKLHYFDMENCYEIYSQRTQEHEMHHYQIYVYGKQ